MNHELQKKVNDRRAVRLDQVFSADYIPLFQGRPRRERIIGKDDFLNLKIALNTTGSIEDLLRYV